MRREGGTMRKILHAVFAAAVLVAMLSGCETPLAGAAVKNNAQTVERLLAENDYSQRELDKALYRAAGNGRHDIAEMLLKRGANVNCRPMADPIAPLFNAAEDGHTKTVAVLLEHGADIHQKGSVCYVGDKFFSLPKTFYITPLAAAAWKGYSDIVSMILDKAADPDIVVQTAIADLENIATKWPEAKAAQTVLQRSLAKMSKPALPAAASYQNAPVVTPSDMTGASFDPGVYHALVIGNNDYQHLPKLRTATNDASAVASLLQNEYGFKVRLLTNATRSDILLAINDYRRTLTEKDNLLMYYAGHGRLDRDADQGYWLPVNAERDNQVEWVSNTSVTSAIRAIQAKHVMVVADSCYSGKLTRGLHITQRTPDYLARMCQKKARVVLSSGGLEPVLDSGGTGNHSIFASAFMAALSANKNILDGTSLFAKIREQVGWNADQIPEYGSIHKAGHGGGDFLFVRKKASDR